ncbi:CRAL/TRIO domain protein [Aspergillus luchuensis]|uniref:Phosphatidylinositol transfer protein SFH5 n=1 Tax=Aspergillus kawachii TaxID=1069201 RepID=A0A146FQZ8_ASPKA|nr:non-classical phosphatidylinositol transfer protein (PITP) [Aspergillus luchuensis]BCR98965.1 non-classical phosphatidylinositol transfer protein (PITP) [Aspergillus luchuensis]BCS11277.1 non-classical phosphatidylinositol transfer protein (PITP) [Aspergillus luchuensis]GAA88181.1 CRAL/TRIO domain protein [Aspergillus luchuensis IFO 4308]GAT27689.1 CRAL/TRIO domain protein [Aspergillus luchuensis]
MADQPEKTAAAAPAAPEAQPSTTTTTTTTEPAVSESQPQPEVEQKVEPVTTGEEAASPAPAAAATEPPVTEPAPAPAQEAPEDKKEEEKPKEETKETKTEEPKEEQKADEPKAEPKAEEAKKEEEQKPAQPEYLAKNPALSQFFDRLSAILSSTGYNEMWGVTLKDSSDVPTVNILIKFLRANEGNVKLAEEQLTKALQWRKEMNPLALTEGRYSAERYGGLGYVTKYPEANGKEVIVTWNVYGNVKSIDQTFGDVDGFIKWRVALMELAVKDLKLSEATTVIDYDGEDPYQMLQVHDYQNVSFLRLNPTIKAASKKTIEVFSMAYPELLREKFFVNVPAIMGWMFAAMKVFLSKNTTRKFHPISNGANLAREFPSLKEKFPKTYGGNGATLEEDAFTVNLEKAQPAPEAPKEEAKEEPKQEQTEAPKEEAKAEPAEAPKEEVKEEAKTEQPAAEEPTKAETAVTAQEAPAAEAK